MEGIGGGEKCRRWEVEVEYYVNERRTEKYRIVILFVMLDV